MLNQFTQFDFEIQSANATGKCSDSISNNEETITITFYPSFCENINNLKTPWNFFVTYQRNKEEYSITNYSLEISFYPQYFNLTYQC